MTKQVFVGQIPMGGGAPITVQSMTNTDSRDAEATLAQICRLAESGCDIVRLSVYDTDCVKALHTIVPKSPVPLVADIHFDHTLAIGAIEQGIAKVRINPGNVGGESKVAELADCLRMHRIPVRIGVNSGSIEKEILARDGGVTAKGMVESALNHARMLEKRGFDDLVLSMKATNVRLTVDAYRLAAKMCPYPLHVGVTEAGLPGSGTVKSAVGIGALLLDGIGDTIRVSLTGDPVKEGPAGLEILRALELRPGADVISCPTCGRTCIDVEGIASAVRDALKNRKTDLKVAVMGCVVNGPGEAREADIGIAGGKTGGMLFVKGEKPVSVRGDLAAILLSEIERRFPE